MRVYLDMAEVRSRLHISEAVWTRLVREGDAPCRVRVTAKHWLVAEDVLEAWLRSREETTLDQVTAQILSGGTIHAPSAAAPPRDGGPPAPVTGPQPGGGGIPTPDAA